MPEDQQNGEIDGYSIQIEGPGTTQMEYIKYYFTKYKKLQVMPSTEYTFSVSAKTVVGCGPAISVSFVTPQEGETSMHIYLVHCLNINGMCLISIIIPISMFTHTALSYTVGSLKTSQYHPTSAQISWAAIREDVVIGYTIQVEGPDSTQEIPITNKYSTSVEISDLLPSTQYTFKVSTMKGIKSTLYHGCNILTNQIALLEVYKSLIHFL